MAAGDTEQRSAAGQGDGAIAYRRAQQEVLDINDGGQILVCDSQKRAWILSPPPAAQAAIQARVSAALRAAR